MLPVKAGNFEDALQTNNVVFLYLYAPKCKYCELFNNNIYTKLEAAYSKKCKFVKVDVETPYGNMLARTYKVKYIPFTAIFNQKAKVATGIPNYCLNDYECSEKTLKSIINSKGN